MINVIVQVHLHLLDLLEVAITCNGFVLLYCDNGNLHTINYLLHVYYPIVHIFLLCIYIYIYIIRIYTRIYYIFISLSTVVLNSRDR